MNEWIDINLPWAEAYSPQPWPEYVEYPLLEKETKEALGFTQDELMEETFGKEKSSWRSSNTYHAFKKEERRIQNEEGIEEGAELHDRLVASENSNVKKMLSYFDKLRQLNKWLDKHPKTKEITAKNEMITKEFLDKKRAEAKSFTGRGLNKAGVLMELEENGTLSQMLIGEINELGGGCDDCRSIGDETIVKRYKVIWERGG